MTRNKETENPHLYALWGMHGGYFLTSRADLDGAVRVMKDALEDNPGLAYPMEFEAFTLDRLANGPQLDVEAKHHEGEWKGEWILEFFRQAVRDKRMDNSSTYTQPILHAIDGESVVRQFGYARRIQRETLGIELEYYTTQEPLWCGQLPAIMSGFKMKGCAYETSWGPFGFAPLKHGESFRWRGPDGSEIRTVAAVPSLRETKLESDKEAQGRHFSAWQNPFYERMNAVSVQAARDAGLDHPLLICLSLDFTANRPAEWFNPCRYTDVDFDTTFTTLGPYLDIARDDGVWEDAFAEFEDRLCWGLEGGQLYLDSQVAANRTILAQRMSVLLGFDHREEEDRLWQATMVSQHHDCWFGSFCMFGHFLHDSYGALIAACRAEVEERADKLFPVSEGPAFSVTNPTQRARREWTEIDLRVAEGAVTGAPGIRNVEGDPVPCRVVAVEQHADGSIARVTGSMLADVEGFHSATYSVGTAGDPARLPVQVEETADGWEIGNDDLRAVVSTDGIRLYRNGVECVSDLHLHAEVERWDQRSTIREIRGVLEESGTACVRAEGVLGCIPFELDVRIKPWSDRFDIHVRCHYDGERTEGKNYWEQDGSLKLVADYPERVSHLLHHPFELRAPARAIHSAVHFVLADREDRSGCAFILDRPSGVVARENSTGIVLCHSGWTLHRPMRAGVRVSDGYRYSHDRVHGTVEYDVGLLPYTPQERGNAATAYQCQAYPLQVTGGQSGSFPIPEIEVEGHSVVSNLSREEQGIVLRLWNPFEEEKVTLKAPGMRLALTDLEGTELEDLGKDKASFPIRPMQIRTVLLLA
ncbi:MAG: hypothetical protein HQ559_03470 [Lentisphaerae bacterium]|nr:hypothetical protein [Lentisphaerota bacterium]